MAFGQTLRLATRLERRALLDKIYAPFRELEKDSPAYIALAKSGRVWEDYHRPGDSEHMGYLECQHKFSKTLAEIDKLRQSTRAQDIWTAPMTMVPAIAHQSVMIEQNSLAPQNSLAMSEEMETTFFPELKLPSLSIDSLARKTPFPRLDSFVTDTERKTTESIELRSHIIASRWIAETADTRRRQATAGFTENDIRSLSIVAMKDLDESGRGFYPWTLGPRIRLGDYRQTPIGVRSNPRAVFPYHLEVPACLGRFFEWRQRADCPAETRVNTQEHPLLFALHSMVYFLQVHPFVDGNGRVSRMILQDDLMRHGYLPSYLPSLDRDEYLNMIHHASDRDPSLLVKRVLEAQLEHLLACQKGRTLTFPGEGCQDAA